MNTGGSIEHVSREACVGAPLELELLVPGMSGHVWRLDPDAGPSWRQVDHRVEPREGVGVGPRIVLTVVFAEAGHALLNAVLQRPWEKTPARSVVFEVEVRPA